MHTENYQRHLAELEKSGNLRKLQTREKLGYKISHNGNWLIDLSSNDYLGLNSNMNLKKNFALENQLNNLQFSSSSSRLLNGSSPISEQLEQTLAYDYDKESALIFNSGYHANLGILPALTNSQDLIIADKLVHASLIDGMKLSQAKTMRFKHNDLTHLEYLLSKYRHQYNNVFLVTESIFSMDGDTAPLHELIALKKQYDLTIYLDEAHAIGCLGSKGLGLAEQKNCLDEIDIIVGTFGKAIASVGAFIVSSKTIIEWLINTMRPLIFSTALPPINILWTKFIWDYQKQSSSERMQLLTLRETVQNELGRNINSHIVPILCKNTKDCINLSKHLKQEGFLGLPIRYPTVPKGKERIRISLQANVPVSIISQFCKTITQWQ